MKNTKNFNVRIILIFICILLCALCALPLVSCDKEQPQKGTSYEIWLDIGEDGIACTQRVNFVNTSEYILDELIFNIYAGAYSQTSPLPCTPQEEADAYPNGVSFGKFEFKGAYGDFQSCLYDALSNLITVNLFSPLLPSQEIAVDFVYSLTPPNTNLRYGFNDVCLSLTGFYPQLCALVEGEWFFREFSQIGDPYFSDTADYEVTFNLPNGCGYVASGLSQVSSADGETFVTSKANNIRDFALIISPVLSRTETEYKGVEISYLGSDTQVIEYAKLAIDVFSERFGEYAYDSLALASVPFVAGGMEYGALCVVNEQLDAIDIESVTAHEIAHQWWYGAVGSNNLTDAWQDEGLAEYSTALYFGAAEGRYREHISAAEGRYRAFVSVREQLSDTADTSMDRPLSAFSGAYEYRSIVYDKSVILFDRLHEVLGDKLISGLRRCFAAAKGGILTPEALVSTLSSGVDVSGIFTSFREGTCVI